MRSKFTLLIALMFVVLATTQCDKKKGETPAEETPAPTTPATGANSVADIIAANGSPVSTVTLDASTANTITIFGNIFEIPANSFEGSTGPVTGIVSLTVKTITTTTKSEI